MAWKIDFFKGGHACPLLIITSIVLIIITLILLFTPSSPLDSLPPESEPEVKRSSGWPFDAPPPTAPVGITHLISTPPSPVTPNDILEG